MLNKEDLLAYFESDIFATKTVGITIDTLEDDCAVCRLRLTDARWRRQRS